jgi:hypothetical protein
MAVASRFPTGNASLSRSWTNGTTAVNADDGTKANFTTTTKNDVRTLTCGSFGFDGVLPALITVNSVAIELQNDGTTGGTQRVVLVRAGVDGAANDNSTGTETVRTFSSLARPSGGSWTARTSSTARCKSASKAGNRIARRAGTTPGTTSRSSSTTPRTSSRATSPPRRRPTRSRPAGM